MKNILATLMMTALTSLAAGCAHVEMSNPLEDEAAKRFEAPAPDASVLYIYRDKMGGTALKKDIWVDGKYIGESAYETFFVKSVAPGEHVVSTESEFSPNHIIVNAGGGKNCFIKQYLKMGLFVGGANLKVMPEEKAKQEITAFCKLGKDRSGSKPDLKINIEQIRTDLKNSKVAKSDVE